MEIKPYKEYKKGLEKQVQHFLWSKLVCLICLCGSKQDGMEIKPYKEYKAYKKRIRKAGATFLVVKTCMPYMPLWFKTKRDGN